LKQLFKKQVKIPLLIIAFTFSFFPSFSGERFSASDTLSSGLTIIIKNIRNSNGYIRAGIYKEDGYGKLSLKNCFQSNVAEAKDSSVTIKLEKISPGNYAIAAWHDKNSNGKCGKYFIGWPSEDYGFSNDARGRYGPPAFKRASFHYSGKDTTIVIYIGDYYFSHAHHDSLAHKNSWVIAPFLGYTPESKVLFGINAARLFKFKGADSSARTSLADVFAIYTMQNQIIIEQNYTIFSNHDRWMDHGYSKYLKFPQYYFGVGNHLPSSNKELISYQEIKLEHVLLRKIAKGMFAGGGFRYVNIFNLTQPAGGILETQQTSGYKGSRSVGLTLAFSSDTRDNIYNSFKGHLIKLRYNMHDKVLGGQFKFQFLEVDLRKFVKLFKSRPDVLAFQLYSQITTGNTPWNEMGTLGNDMIMRGYYAGRYRDNNLFAVQAEYRLYLTKSFGLVSFLGFGDVANKLSNYNLADFKPSYGAGARFRIDNKEKLNLRFDYGFGHQTHNLYITVTEAF
jgi:uncharacterized protein (DUF2141 family)